MTKRPPPSRHNHYVPEWYQKGFNPEGKCNLFLDLAPPQLRPDGTPVPVVPRLRPPKSCFWELDLYVTRFGQNINDQIETVLFAGIDDMGATAIRAFINADALQMHKQYEAFFSYMGAQKLRTPKGLDWIRSRYPALSQIELMIELQHLRNLYGVLWAEAVREIVSAEDADVKFLVSDHPVTTFNAALPWDLPSRVDSDDAPVSLNGTQTIFPLDANHCLILTHLPYAKAPQDVSPITKRENARHFGSTLIRTDALIRSRLLNSDDVITINHLLKARARRYIAAAEADWLYPERMAAVNPHRVAQVLMPPQDGLWHFGGEIYIGHKDGRVDYRDAFGRTSKAYELLAKVPPQEPPASGDTCPCGSGATFNACCELLQAWERPPWDVMSLRERNLTLIRAVAGILGLDGNRSWDDVRRELSDDQVARIHSVVRGLWPEGTDLAALLPRPNRRVARAVYMGLSDPRTVASSVISLAPLFDQLLVMDPFLNPANMRPEYSPVESPSQHKQQFLKNVFFILMIEPLIKSGKLLLFPDPADLVPEFQRAMRTMAEERTAEWRFQDRHMDDLRWLAHDDFQRSLSQLPSDVLRSMAKRSSPDLADSDLDRFVADMRKQQQRDPLALLQPLPRGEGGAQLMTVRSVNLEVAMFIAQLTGAVIVTDIKALWEHLHLHTRLSSSGAASEKVDAQSVPVRIRLHANPNSALALSGSAEAAAVRDTLRAICAAVAGRQFHNQIGDLISQFEERLRYLTTIADRDLSQATDETVLRLSIPVRGFESPTVQRLVVSFGRENALVSVGLALLRSSLTPDSDGAAQSEPQ